jgi:hypothetical protein
MTLAYFLTKSKMKNKIFSKLYHLNKALKTDWSDTIATEKIKEINMLMAWCPHKVKHKDDLVEIKFLHKDGGYIAHLPKKLFKP